MKNLIIVESPTKARTIGRYLGSDYEIKASMGHLMDLPKSKLGVDTEHDFKPDYQRLKDKSRIIAELKSAAKSAEQIILATDPDREGEAIASHVKDVLGLNSKFARIVFHEITKEAIQEALKNPRSIDSNLVDAQTSRRVLDRLVGYKLSPLLWKKVRRGLSAGRVQSVALRLIVEREREIEKFKKENYWTIITVLRSPRHFENSSNASVPPSRLIGGTRDTVAFGDSSEEFSHVETPRTVAFDLIEINGEKIELPETFNLYDGEYTITKTCINTSLQAEKIVDDLKTKEFIISDVLQKETRRFPQAPYTTSTLQQDAARRLGMSGKKTMNLAQKLYEEGFITYHRTDSVTIAQSAQNSLRTYIEKEYGEKYLPKTPRIYLKKQKLAQEAHEAIRPTNVNNQQSTINNQLGGAYEKLYELIWRRAVASQMEDAIIESTTVIVDSQNQKSNIKNQKDEDYYKLKANGSVLVFEGFLKVNPQALGDNKLPEFNTGEKLDLINAEKEEHETPAPPRYNDASLIKTLEEKGIGRPSTYATIVSTIESRRYIERQEQKFIPTTVGVAVNDFLVSNFSDIDDIPFTAEMEDGLDEVANGKKDWVKMMKDFYKPFSKKIETTEDAKRVKIEVEKTDEKCEKCGAPLVIRMGKFGKFLSCSRFPDCDFTKSFVEETNVICPKCGGKVIVRKTKKGRKFYGCSNYPKCDFAAWKLENIKK